MKGIGDLRGIPRSQTHRAPNHQLTGEASLRFRSQGNQVEFKVLFMVRTYPTEGRTHTDVDMHGI